jgi:hypothetical protein
MSVLILEGLPIQFIYQRNESTLLGVCINEIHQAILVSMSPTKSYLPIPTSRKQTTKVLSSNQLFFSVVVSPRPECMLGRKWDLDQSLKAAPISAFHQTEQMITQIFGCKLAVPDLRQVAATASKELSLPCPNKEARRLDLIEWFHQNWDSISSMFNELTRVEDPL